jgi:hypothetical protein
MSNHVLQSSNDAADRLADVRETSIIQLEYVMGKKNCIKIGNVYPVIHSLMDAYGNYFKVLKEVKITLKNAQIAEKNAQKVLHYALKDFINKLPETMPPKTNLTKKRSVGKNLAKK